LNRNFVPNQQHPDNTPNLLKAKALLSMESSREKFQQVPRELPAMFRPPVNRAMKTLDRSFFRKTVPIAAAKIFEKSQISNVRQALGKNKDLLVLPRLNVVRDFKEQDGAIRKGLLLREDVKADGW
jgi:tRNA (guanine37-N1)-methyltransferase